ncbi:MAG: helix-turn-helix-type transcriptional regulator, partial [Phaeodactylibacter sp.]|nr:helix-turn-helix-type transcriptional regulator [Phaeodactylibacter sp.]
DAHAIYRPDLIYTMISESFAKSSIHDYVQSLSESFPDTTILLSGYQIIAQEVQTKGNVRVLQSLQETTDFLNQL